MAKKQSKEKKRFTQTQITKGNVDFEIERSSNDERWSIDESKKKME